MGHHHPALPAVGRFGQFLRELGERHAVYGEPSARVGGGLDPPAIRPAAHGIGTDPQEARRLLDPEGGHPATLTQLRLETPISGAFARVSSYLAVYLLPVSAALFRPAIASAPRYP